MTNALILRYIILRSIRAFKALSSGGALHADGLEWSTPAYSVSQHLCAPPVRGGWIMHNDWPRRCSNSGVSVQ